MLFEISYGWFGKSPVLMHPALELDGIAKSFAGRTVLDRLSLSVGAGEYMTVLGPSGSGKSTMLRVIAGFDPLDGGDIRVDGQSMRGHAAHERGVGFVFQSFALFPHLSVADNVAFGLRHRRRDPVTDPADIARRVAGALELTGLQGLGGRLPSQISGGQKQRVAFARTLIAEPSIVLLDEPLGALDARLRERMMTELRRIHDRLGATFLHVTGNEQEALAMGTRVAVLSDGRIAQVDAPDTLVDAPASRDVARLLNCYNVLSGRVADGVFAAPGLSLPLQRSAGPGNASSGTASYCIRSDNIAVVAADAPPRSGQVRVPGKFLASEYSGARIIGLFDVDAGRPFEVEYYLGHRTPPDFARDRVYALEWPAGSALLFAEA